MDNYGEALQFAKAFWRDSGQTETENNIPFKKRLMAPFCIQQHPDTRARFDKVSALVEGFESPFGLELLSSVHWVMNNEEVNTVEEVVQHTYAWNERKRQFTPRQIALAVDVLANKGWAAPSLG